MGTAFGGLVGMAAAVAAGQADLDRLFGRWDQARRDTQALVVEFGLERRNNLLKKVTHFDGTFRLLRTPAGVLASCEFRPRPPAAGEATKYVLTADAVYELTPDRKSAIEYGIEFGPGGVGGFMERYFNPLVVLADPPRARAACRLTVANRDDWYTYLAVEPARRTPDWDGDAVVAVMAAAGGPVPQGLPRTVRVTGTNGQETRTYDFRSWRVNPADGPTPDEFAAPDPKDGWQVGTWPWRLTGGK